jgi:hypothetical protein
MQNIKARSWKPKGFAAEKIEAGGSKLEGFVAVTGMP